MGKTVVIEPVLESNFDIGLEKFEELLSNFSVDTPPTSEDCLLLTLTPGKWCFVRAGIRFDIIDFDYSAPAPGYVTYLGNGSCGIYAESCDVKLKFSRHSRRDESYGRALSGQAQFGPFSSTVGKTTELTNIWYFNRRGSNTVGALAPTNIEADSHVLMLNTRQCIIDCTPDAYLSFTEGVHWRDVYSNQFTMAEHSYAFEKPFISSKQEIDISLFLAADEKISKFICRTTLSSGELGMKLKLPTRTIEWAFDNPDEDIMLFHVSNTTFLIIPKTPNGNILVFDTPQCVCEKGLKVIGMSKATPYHDAPEQRLFYHPVGERQNAPKGAGENKVDIMYTIIPL